MRKVLDVLFKNWWMSLLLMMLVAIADLVALPSIDFGLGFVLAFFYAIGYIIYSMTKPKI